MEHHRRRKSSDFLWTRRRADAPISRRDRAAMVGRLMGDRGLGLRAPATPEEADDREQHNGPEQGDDQGAGTEIALIYGARIEHRRKDEAAKERSHDPDDNV